LMMGTWLPETCWATIKKRNKEYKKWHLVGFSYPHWITMHGQPHIRFTKKAVHRRSISQPVCLSISHWPLHPTLSSGQRQLHHTRYKTTNHGRFHSRGFCCVVAGVLSDLSNKIGNEGVKNYTPSTWLVRIKARYCFETSAFAIQWHGVNCTAVTAPTSQTALMHNHAQ
jgi:hypothetical protein